MPNNSAERRNNNSNNNNKNNSNNNNNNNTRITPGRTHARTPDTHLAFRRVEDAVGGALDAAQAGRQIRGLLRFQCVGTLLVPAARAQRGGAETATVVPTLCIMDVWRRLRAQRNNHTAATTTTTTTTTTATATTTTTKNALQLRELRLHRGGLDGGGRGLARASYKVQLLHLPARLGAPLGAGC